MQDEIVAGLKNAIERGDTMENAIQSFINAGYNPATVREAAQLLSTGASAIVLSSEAQQYPQSKSENKLEAPSTESQFPAQKQPQQYFYQKQKRSTGKLILIIILIILLILMMGAIVSTLLFGDKILDFLKS